MPPQLNAGVRHNVVAIPFHKTDIANASGSLSSVQGTDIITYTFPNGGAIIGASINLSGSLQTGSIQLAPTIAGNAQSPFPGILYGEATSLTATASADTYRFAAGQTVGLTYQKTGTIDPTSRDATGLLIVLLEGVEY